MEVIEFDLTALFAQIHTLAIESAVSAVAGLRVSPYHARRWCAAFDNACTALCALEAARIGVPSAVFAASFAEWRSALTA